jgi:amino acid adenylation domain-containing protein/non-ribosomal peptide synthase protein (TIGR01720 family)
MNSRMNSPGKMAVIANQYKKEKEYWLQKMSGTLVKSHFPYDFSIPGQYERDSGKEFETAGIEFSTEFFLRLMEISRGSDYALYIILVSGLVSLLYKYTENKDIITGVPIFKQAKEGKFINTVLAVRSRIEAAMTFKQLLTQVKESVLEADANMNFPIEILLNQLDIPYTGNDYFPLFDTMILLENIQEKNYINDINVNLKFYFRLKEKNIDGTVAYKPGWYRKETIQTVIAHYINLLGQALSNPHQPLSALDILAGQERERILYIFNNTAAEYRNDSTIHQLFEEQAQRRPDQVAVVYQREHLTYNQLDARAGWLARILRGKGVSAEVIVGIKLYRSVEMMLGILGVLKAGGAYLPIDPGYPEERIEYMLKDSRVRILLRRLNKLSKLNEEMETIEIPEIDEKSLTQFIQTAKLTQLSQPQHLAYVIYTSGSTGKPKGVTIEHHSVINRLNWMQRYYSLNCSDTILQKTPYTFDVSVWELLWWGIEGARICFLEPGGEKDPEIIIDAVYKEKITVMHFVPSMLNVILSTLRSSDIKKMSSLKQVFASGEALTVEQVNKFNQLLFQTNSTRLANLYGPTEATIDVSYFDCAGIKNFKEIPIGKPIDNIRLYITDEENRLQPVGIPGELCISGVGVARGYLNKPELTAEKFITDPFFPGNIMYKTGDISSWTCDGELRFRGRRDLQVKIRGVRIEIGEIENQLLRIDRVKELVVDIKESESGDKYLCAFVVAKEGDSGPELDTYLRDSLKRTLPEHMIPAYFVRIDKLPLTANGKLNRKALPAPKTAAETGYIPPANEIQEKIAKTWQQVVEHEKIGIRDNFFKVGGDSINAITLISTLNAQFNTHLAVADLYKHQTIEEFSKQLVKAHSTSTYHDEFLQQALEDIEEYRNRYKENNKMTDEIEDVYPMSEIEKGMVYHYLKDPGGAFYFEQNAYKVIYKDFNIETFKQALTLMVKKHPILRTGFDVDDFAHVIYKNVSPVVSDYDISSMTQQEQKTYVLNYMEKSRKVMFQRLTPPLWRMSFFKPGSEYVIILMELHHAVLDGWSLSLFLTELERIYLQLKSQKQVNPGKLKCSYKEFITSETAVKKRIAAREYWKNELSGYKRITFPPTGQERKEYKEIEINSGGQRLEQLQITAAKHNTSLKHLCFAAYVYALGMFSYENDIVLGLITNNRPICDDGDRLLGCFLNTIPVRMQIPTHIKWHEYIKQIDEKLIEIKKYDMMPFNEIVKITEEKPGDQNPIFDCTFNYIDFYFYQNLMAENSLADTSVGRYIKTNTLLDFHVDVSLKIFQVFCDYSTSFISDIYCKKLCTYFQEVLNKFIDEPEKNVIKSAVIPEIEKHKMLFEFNNTRAKYPEEKTIHRLYEEQVERTPFNIAVVGQFPGENRWKPYVHQLTYRELNEISARLAQLLRKRGVQPDTIVGIMIDRSVEMILGIMGILKVPGAYMPLDPDYPQERIEFMLIDSGAKVLVTIDEISNMIKAKPSSCQKSANASLLQLTPPTNLSYVIYTSGSTGKPKGVMIAHRSVVNRLNWMQKAYLLNETDVILQKTPITFDVSVWELFWWSFQGASLCLLEAGEEMNPTAIIDAVEKSRVTTIHFVPSMLSSFLEYLQEAGDISPGDQKDRELLRLASLRQVFASGEGLSIKNVEKFNNMLTETNGTQLINLYGPTEATVDVTYFQCPPLHETRNISSIPIGKPIDNIRLYVFDKYLDLQPLGVSGELCISGLGLAKGYLNRPELTAEKFLPLSSSFYRSYIPKMIYRTGDLARWLPDGNIEFLGRLDFQVKIRGNRIELGEIEKQLLTYQNIKEAVVTAKKDQKGNGYLCAYLVPTTINLDKHAFKLSGIREYLSRYLPEYMIPAHFVVLPGFPLTGSGKIDRRDLPEPEGINLAPDTEYTAPRDDIEKNLVDIWQQVLGKNIIGIHDNFFELGGDSIKAIQIASRMHKAGYKIEMRDIFQLRRISDLAALVKKIEHIADQSIITGTISLTPIQKWFFANHAIDPHHFNQAMMLYIYPGEEFSAGVVRTIFAKLQEHHDALRISCRHAAGEMILTNHGLEYPLSLAEYDFRGGNNAVQMLEQKAVELQASIDLGKGPLMKLGLFHLDDGHRLLMVIHHLVIDGVSWRILFEDLETLYMQYRRGEEFSLPLKTDSFKTWSEKLHEYANDQSFLKEKLYWQTLAGQDLPVIKKDFPVETDYLKDKNALSFTLNEEETSLLLTKANVAFGTEISDLLLTALGLGLKETFAIQRILIALEGHGREEIIKDVDITRTVGWFTSLYPVLLDFSYENDLSRQIKDIKENLHRVPNKGIGYGILKYLTAEELTGDINFILEPQICFNYLGQFDTDIKQFSSFQIAKESPGNPRSPKEKQEYLFVITGIIVNNCLELTIEYNKNHFKLETIEKLLHCCQVNLKQLIVFCLDRETSELTPSDLDYREFTIDELGNLFE